MRAVLWTTLTLLALMAFIPTSSARIEWTDEAQSTLERATRERGTPHHDAVAPLQLPTPDPVGQTPDEVKEPNANPKQIALRPLVRPDNGAHEPDTIYTPDSPTSPNQGATAAQPLTRSWMSRTIAQWTDGAEELLHGLTPNWA